MRGGGASGGRRRHRVSGGEVGGGRRRDIVGVVPQVGVFAPAKAIQFRQSGGSS